MAGGEPGISVRDHCLNVGCVAEALIARLPPCVRGLIPPGATALAALHDVGKISPGFQRKCPYWRQRFETNELERSWGQGETNHAAVSHALIGSWLGKSLAGYAVAAGGHHGIFVDDGYRPSIGEAGRNLRAELDDPVFAGPRKELCEIIEITFGEGLPERPLGKSDEALVVFLTGFLTFADWLGSNETFFRPETRSYVIPIDVKECRRLARQKTRDEMDWLKWGVTAVQTGLQFDRLFPFPANAIQRCLPELATQPGLFIVEAPMGSGKTEAALAAAYRRWTADNGERGLYFALPSQLTSERILDRLEKFLSRALAKPDLATLVHGSAWLRDERRVLEIRPAFPEERPAGDNDPTAEYPAEYARDARLWFASSRQALLAPFGAGTVDQALLSVLPAKHCGLRLFGLAGKVVVLDEVHSYDNYTGTLVEKLVTDLIRLNATVIVLSATLTAAHKRRLLQAAGISNDSLPAMTPTDPYPTITRACRDSAGQCQARVQPVIWETPRKIITLDHRSRNDESVWREACEAALSGACVLIIRNTVAAAQETYRRLNAETCEGGPAVALLHSRFPRWRRDTLEDEWITTLGKKGPRPHGCLLVSTQIVEQSVDIDSDLLITDLAPTDLLFQRLGRLHRHPLQRPEKFHAPRALILHPELQNTLSANELKAAFGSSGKVYPPYVLWRSYHQWMRYSKVVLPEDIRPWLEATYDEFPAEEPIGAQELFEDWQQGRDSIGNVAQARTSRLTRPKQRDEEGIFTRWNEQPTANLLLLGSKPEQSPSRRHYRLTLLDGETIEVRSGQWIFSVAKAVYSNIVRVPLYAVSTWREHTPSWMRDYLDHAAVGVVERDIISPLGLIDSRYNLSWHFDEGVGIDKAEAGRPVPYQGDELEDGWW